MAIRVIFAPSADLARSASADVTIEAEYGSYVWEGSLFTAAEQAVPDDQRGCRGTLGAVGQQDKKGILGGPLLEG